MADRNHDLIEWTKQSVVMGVTKENGRIYANADFRKEGGVAGF